MVFVLADIIVVPVVIIAGLKLLARSPLALRTSLSSKSGYSSFDEKSGQYIGKTGQAATDLRPSGTAIIDDKRVDVVTRGDYIEKGSQIRVIDVEGSRVVVRKTES
jgi:membrane-bound serine protease (ClpP class)